MGAPGGEENKDNLSEKVINLIPGYEQEVQTLQTYRVGETNITALKLYFMSDLGFLQRMHIQSIVQHISSKSFIKDLP